MTITRLIRYIVVGVVLAAITAGGIDLATFDRKAWLDDYSRLKSGLARDYANLDWMVAHRGFDPVALDHKTTRRLKAAYSNVQAYYIIDDFIRAFDDPHLHTALGDAPTQAVAEKVLAPLTDTSEPAASRTPAKALVIASCDVAGYEDDDPATELAYPDMPEWRPVNSAYFLAGNIGSFGIVRIAEFGENKYAAACRSAFRDGMDARDLQLATRAVLNADLAGVIKKLKTAGATRMIVDVTGNGGGSEWSREVAVTFATGTMSRYKAMMPDPTCDRAGLWSGKPVCPIFAWPPERDEMDGKGLWDGPLFILIDTASASATEEFAVWLRDNDKVLLVGSKTFGAGCGFVDGGRAVQFRSAPFHVMMPNCARFTKEGRNEIEGLEPDIGIDWTGTNAANFAEILKKLE